MSSVQEIAYPRPKSQPTPPQVRTASSVHLRTSPKTSESSCPIIRYRFAHRLIQVSDCVLLTRFCAPKGWRGSIFARLHGNARACAEVKIVLRRATTQAVARSPGGGDAARQRVSPLGFVLRGTPPDTSGRVTGIRFGARDSGSRADGPVIPMRHGSGAERSSPVASRLPWRHAGTLRQGNPQRPADARQQDNGGPGPTAARPPKREIGCAAPRTRLRGTRRGRGVVALVTRRDSASLRRPADGSHRDRSKLGAIASGRR
jgi:hypothetical protein